MSRVTNVILHMGCVGEDEAGVLLSRVNYFFKDQPGFVLVDDEKLPRGWYGGTKMLECDLAIGAFNYLDVGALILYLRTLDWPERGDVQLMVKEQDESNFRLINVFPEEL